MRWDRTISLLSVATAQDSEGVPRESVEAREVYANAHTVGLNTWVAARSAGLHADSSVQVRSADYMGEQRVEMDGKAYDVERVKDDGEFAVLTLKERLHG